MIPRLIIEQKITPLANQYKIFATTETGDKNGLVAYAHQKRFAFREKVEFFNDTNKTETLFIFRAEKVMDIHGKFFVEEPNGQPIGSFQKVFGKSLLNSTWKIQDSAGKDLYTVSESNNTLAVLRRYAEFIPFIGDLLDLLLNFFKYHFKFVDDATGVEVGRYNKTTLFFDKYCLQLDDSAYNSLDWRVFAAFSVALDALQGR